MSLLSRVKRLWQLSSTPLEDEELDWQPFEQVFPGMKMDLSALPDTPEIEGEMTRAEVMELLRGVKPEDIQIREVKPRGMATIVDAHNPLDDEFPPTDPDHEGNLD